MSADRRSPGFPAPACAGSGATNGRGGSWRRTTLSTADLIWPIFLIDGANKREPVASMPGVDRVVGRSGAGSGRAKRRKLGIPVIALFPYTDPARKTEDGREALNPDNLVCRATRAVKATGLDIGVLCDVALDPYTSHGHDGLLKDGMIVNDETRRGAGRAGARPGARGLRYHRAVRHDGRTRRRDPRRRSSAKGIKDTLIMAYAAKYASAFYGPFRDAIGSAKALKGDKRTYQMDPANGDEALREVALDIAEGADMVMVKPGMPYLDIVRRVKDAFGDADLRLSGVGRVFDDHGGGRARLDRRATASSSKA